MSEAWSSTFSSLISLFAQTIVLIIKSFSSYPFLPLCPMWDVCEIIWILACRTIVWCFNKVINIKSRPINWLASVQTHIALSE